jgi:hypothetical protein
MSSHKLSIIELAKSDALDFLCGGRLLGEGSFRSVYGYLSTGGNFAIKIAKCDYGIRCNIEEYNTWQDLSHFQVSRWFAPCVSISKAGTILLQDYTENLRPGKYKIPAFFEDVKPENFGLLNGKIVCRDYGQSSLRLKGMKATPTQQLIVT